ncbi:MULTISPECIES: hypothetical protein [unclassified Marinovum]
MIYRTSLGAVALLLLTGCTDMGNPFKPRDRQAADPVAGVDIPAEAETAEATVAPVAPVAPPANATSEEAFDTTSAADREQAAEVPAAGGEALLGTTVASLGDPARAGFWLETPLVDVAGPGRVEFPETGKSAQVDLIPIEGAATAGSRISLSAMRLIGAPLTGLPTIKVFR